jgi:2-oxoglutarate dehydrogenase E1 component
MARQESNEAFQLSSFLYGGNAGYVEDLYARYQTDPDRWMANGAGSSLP